MKSILRSSLLVTAILIVFGNANAHFTSKGPFGGSVKTLALSGTALYLGSAEGGVYYLSTATATTWTYVNYNGLASGKINAVSGIGSNVIAATADKGVFYSLDKGVNWKSSTLSTTGVNAFAVLGSKVFAGSNGNGIFISSDTGKTWIAPTYPANVTVVNNYIRSFAVDGNDLYVGTDDGVYKTSDNATTWTQVNTGLSNNITINALSISNGTIYAGTNNGIFTATTSSISWTATTSLGNSTVNGLYSFNGTTYAATNGGVYSIPDGATTWSAANIGYTGIATSVAVFANRVYLGSPDGGIFRTPITTTSWAAFNNGFNNLESYAVYNNGNLVIAATNKGLFVSRNLATSYTASNTGLTDSLNVQSLAFVGTKLYAATKNGGVFVTADTGKTWTAANSGLTNLSIKSIIAVTSFLVIVGTNGSVYSSPTSSINWTAGTGLPSVTPTSLATDGTNFFLGTLGNGVYTSTNSSSWTAFNTGLTNQSVTSLVVKGSWVYAGTSGAGVFRAEVNVNSWVAANNGLPSLFITALAANDKWVATGYKGGVYTTSNNATTWDKGGTLQYIPSYSDVIAISFGSTTTGSTRLFIATPKNTLYSQGYGEIVTSTVTGLFDYNDEYSATSTDVQVFPNPNNGSFRLQFEAGLNPSEVVVSDYTGRPVKTITSNFEGQLSIEGTPGIYFVQVHSNKKTSIKKILVE